MLTSGASVFLGILTVGFGFIGVWLNDRRLTRQAAEATAARVEAAAVAEAERDKAAAVEERNEMERALRERLDFKDEQIKVKDELLQACHERNATLMERVRSLGGSP